MVHAVDVYQNALQLISLVQSGFLVFHLGSRLAMLMSAHKNVTCDLALSFEFVMLAKKFSHLLMWVAVQ